MRNHSAVNDYPLALSVSLSIDVYLSYNLSLSTVKHSASFFERLKNSIYGKELI